MAESSISICLATYFAGAFAMLAWLAFLDRHWLREAFWLSVLWPITLFVFYPWVLLTYWLELHGWCADVKHQPDLSPFGFRRRMHGVGWAVRCFWLELQIWQFKREPK